MTLRILHVLDHSVPLHSGYTFRTLAILREQRALGWQTYHLTSPKQGPTDALEEEVDGFRFLRAQAGRHETAGNAVVGAIRQIALMRKRIEEVTRRVRPHAIHAHSPVLNALPAIAVGRKLGLPVVYEVRAFWEDAAVDHGTARAGGIRYRLTQLLETYALRRADHVTTICEGLQREIVARGIPVRKVTVIPNAVDVARFQVEAAPNLALREQLGIAGKTVIGFIGSFYAYEGLDTLLRALPAIVARRPEARVLLVGGGPKEAELRRLALDLGVQDLVQFTGRVPHAEVHRYYGAVDVLAYPRHSMRLTEIVTPLKPLEAMAQGKVLLASDVGGHRELIRHDETGILFRADDVGALASAVIDLLARRSDWDRLRMRARSFVERERSWAASVARYRAVYGALVSGTAEWTGRA
jgi:PEP-CTERM/exosortase A-associated glycosyltransferase